MERFIKHLNNMELLKQFYEDLKKFLSSRTIITLLAMLAFNLLNEFSGRLPVEFVTVVNILLTTLAAYFRIDLKAKF